MMIAIGWCSVAVVSPSLALSATAPLLEGKRTHRVPLRRRRRRAATETTDDAIDGGGDGVYALALSLPVDSDGLDPGINFLATQVWPSSRAAAAAVVDFLPTTSSTIRTTTVCEFGCGPGLPSLAAAKLEDVGSVTATDVDPLALELAGRAAAEQGLSGKLRTELYDLVDGNLDNLPKADLYLLSDVFESDAVGIGAARVVDHLLSEREDCSVWVFAQSDRVQREAFLREMKRYCCAERRQGRDEPGAEVLAWRPYQLGPPPAGDNSRLWLCDVDEVASVTYG